MLAMKCLFCSIVRKEISAEIVYEDDYAVAFLDIHPHAPGHTMVIPRIHAENIIELPSDGIGPLFRAVQSTVRKIQEALAPSGFTIGINHGKVSGQAVEHLHIHIMPRFPGDGGGSVHGAVMNPPKEDLKIVGERIRKGR